MHFPALIQDLAVILGVAAIVTFVFRRIRQPVVLGYIIAGIIVGPYTPAVFSVTDTENIKIWAELGVIFLMFSLGLEFSFRSLARVGLSAFATSAFQIVTMMCMGFLVGHFFKWSRMDAVFLGCMISISSTTIIIKALAELNLNTKKFAELVFGILIVEDLAAILMLVALTNIVTTSQFGGMELAFAAGKLILIVAIWFVVGMFFVPRLVDSVSKHGNDEMLTVVSIGLCLALVVFAAKFHYSVALGAFIMGSILAESSQVKRIEHLVQPLKDIFGAVFFVSVGMLLDPQVIVTHGFEIAVLSMVIILGKLFSVTLGAIATGQSVQTSFQTAFSMAQIGEFSFIIATLGLAYGAINSSIYPIIVASSLITTFTTPYLIKLSIPCADLFDRMIHPKFKSVLMRYGVWIRSFTSDGDRYQRFVDGLVQWFLNGVIVIAIFTVGANQMIAFVSRYYANSNVSTILAWAASFILSSPSLYAMFGAFRNLKENRGLKQDFILGSAKICSHIATIGLLGLLSVEYFPARLTLMITLIACALFIFVFRRQMSMYYRWLERQFRMGFHSNADLTASSVNLHDRLVPWDARLIEVRVPGRSPLVGSNLKDLGIRETYGLNVVVISRDGVDIIAPKAQQALYPGDLLLCFGTDSQMEHFKFELEKENTELLSQSDSSNQYELKRIRISEGSRFSKKSIKESGISAEFNCIVVGLERNSTKVVSPLPALELDEGDVLWVVGEMNELKKMSAHIESKNF